MNTDRMDTSAVYGLFEELKQSLTEMTTSLKGRSEQQTIDLSKIEELFGKMRSIGQIAGYYFHVVVLWVKLQATVLGVCWAIFLSL